MEDTRDFLSKSSYLQDTPENAITVFFDMIVLYPKILYEEGIDIMRAFVNEISDKPISTENLYRLAWIVYKKNYLELGDEIFHQLLGPTIVFMAGF